MPEINNELERFLQGAQGDNTQHFPVTPEDPFIGIEQNNDEQDSSEKIDFHKDPKVQKYIQKEISKALQGQQPQVQQPTVQAPKTEEASSVDEAMAAWSALVGEDTPEKKHVLNMMRKTFKDLEDKATRPFQEMKAQEEAEQQKEAQAEKDLSEGFDAIEEKYSVDMTSDSPIAKKERSEFIDFLQEISPKDSDGIIVALPNMTGAYDAFRRLKAATPSRAKQLASSRLDRSTEAPANAPTDNSWKAVEKMLEGLR